MTNFDLEIGEEFTVIRATTQYRMARAEEGGYVVCDETGHPLSQGETFEEALANAQDAQSEMLQVEVDLRLRGELK